MSFWAAPRRASCHEIILVSHSDNRMGIDTGIKPGAQGNYSRDNAGASGVVVKGDDDAILARDDDTRVARVYLESLGMKLCAYD